MEVGDRRIGPVRQLLNALGLADDALTPGNLRAIAQDTEQFLRQRMELSPKDKSF